MIGAPWRCGVQTTEGGIARIGLGHLLGEEHASTHQSGWRLLACKNGTSPDWIIVVVADVVVLTRF